jgi:hypothetical protein
MNHAENNAYSLKNILGTALLLFGAILCYFHVTAGIQYATHFVPAGASDAIGFLPASGLVAAILLQDLTLNPSSAISAVLYFLLSCWPVATLLLGVVLLRKSIFAPFPAPSSLTSPFSAPQGVRE